MEPVFTPAPPLFRTPSLLARHPGLLAAESTRHGGVSPAPFVSLNLGGSTADAPAHIAENRRRFHAALGLPPDRTASSHQVHGCEVLTVTQPGHHTGYDALVTNQPNVFLVVTVADCTPVLLYDPVQRAVAAVHAGWRGTAGGIVTKVLDRMQEAYGTRPSDCIGYIGTCIDECSFEVDADVADHFAPDHKRFDVGLRKYFVDLKAANAAQLRRAGVPVGQLEISAYSTVLHNHDYFSYRKENGQTGRMQAIIGLVTENLQKDK
jgi:polyphenol oxidase